MPERLSLLAREWEAEIASLSSALSSLSASTTQACTEGTAAYVQQLEQQLAAAQQAYGLLQTWLGLG